MNACLRTLATVAMITGVAAVHADDEGGAAGMTIGTQAATATAGIATLAVPLRDVAMRVLDVPPAGMVHNGRDLHFKPEMGVFTVSGHREVYFWDGHYYQLRNQRWVRAASLDRPLWRFVPEQVLPPGLLDQG